MTGEMSKADVTREDYPLHFAVADAIGGSVEPFDVYQGPYVLTPAHERLFLTNIDGVSGRWWNESTNLESRAFHYEGKWAAQLAIDAAHGLLKQHPDNQVLVSLTRAQCVYLRNLLHEAAMNADDDMRDDFIAEIVDQLEQAES